MKSGMTIPALSVTGKTKTIPTKEWKTTRKKLEARY